jgi:hypothetical protein
MGLDMYLSASKSEHNYKFMGTADSPDNEAFVSIVNALNANDFVDTDSPFLTVDINVAYWRKANAIHGWFVKNVQGGNDDCGRYRVPRESLVELQEACLEALANRDSKVLDPTEGFFFGSSDKDEYWQADLRETVTIIGTLLKIVPEEWSFYYQSSW